MAARAQLSTALTLESGAGYIRVVAQHGLTRSAVGMTFSMNATERLLHRHALWDILYVGPQPTEVRRDPVLRYTDFSRFLVSSFYYGRPFTGTNLRGTEDRLGQFNSLVDPELYP
ncbi:hypothetical protein BC826DRAFT_1189267 [Russula brevipes]|nr:hypothetical protein BC826DRAFT_1189267 [Russula brevipes]